MRESSCWHGHRGRRRDRPLRRSDRSRRHRRVHLGGRKRRAGRQDRPSTAQNPPANETRSLTPETLRGPAHAVTGGRDRSARFVGALPAGGTGADPGRTSGARHFSGSSSGSRSCSPSSPAGRSRPCQMRQHELEQNGSLTRSSSTSRLGAFVGTIFPQPGRAQRPSSRRTGSTVRSRSRTPQPRSRKPSRRRSS